MRFLLHGFRLSFRSSHSLVVVVMMVVVVKRGIRGALACGSTVRARVIRHHARLLDLFLLLLLL